MCRRIPVTAPLAVLCASTTALAQTFVIDTASMPPQATSLSYQSDFGDIDRDGDPDIGVAVYGGNRLWINNGGLQGGTAGVFADGTATRLPIVASSSRDIDFADIDADGDLDIHLSGNGDSGGDVSRWWINMGGAQGATEGFFQDQTSTRWLDLDTGSTSIAHSQVVATGGFLDWSWDGELGDLDGDGDLDLFHTSVGQFDTGNVPTRVFLNDGSGAFREFNPSGYRLPSVAMPASQPGLWCEGTQVNNTTNATGLQCDITDNSFESELADFDGDFDLDFLLGGFPDKPRFFRNRLGAGGLAFRDETSSAFPTGYASTGGYGQGIADLDKDGDLDIYGLNWIVSNNDQTLINGGLGTFTIGATVPLSSDDEEDADFLDYDNDGDLDVVLAGYVSSQELYRNELGGAGGFTKQSTLIQGDSTVTWDNDVSDVDLDGDTDFIVSNTSSSFCTLFRNTSQVADTFAPTIPKLEQALDRVASSAATVVRSYVYDNTSDYVVASYAIQLEYSVNGGAFTSAPMRWLGAQVFRGEIPGYLSGSIAYRVRATDRRGNVGVSNSKSFNATPWTSYCTSGVSSNACVGSMSASGTPSASAGSGFTLTATSIEGQKSGLFFYGLDGRIAQPWGTTTSFLCAHFPVQRTAALASGGTTNACDGALSLDWNAWIASNPTALGQPFATGTMVDAQAWYRDPPSSKTTALTNALEFVVAP